MRLMHMLILVVLLVGSDLAIGFYGHYTGATDETPTFSSFFEYISEKENQDELFVVFIFAIIIVLIMKFVLRIG